MTAETGKELVLGTAGHIDHGKSSLVKLLTGTDPDRLAEEKSRGITIELGFAQLELPGGLHLGVVDVPGHERFVRQMIAGATGIDLALLCIAADDGVMPQTEEHLAVLELLGVPTCVVALTKSDLVDKEWIDFVREDIRTRLESTPYAQAPIIPCSSVTGEGIDELKAALANVARATARIKQGNAARLPIDRVFTIKGAGTVVTGTLWNGQIAVGDKVEILPEGIQSRVRGIQVHGAAVERAEAGQRVALNLNAVSTDEVRPGDFIATPGELRSSYRFDADLSYLGVGLGGGSGYEPKPLASGTRVHIAHGAREVTGRVYLLDGREELPAGAHALVQIRLDKPLPVLWRDRFVIRSFSPVHVIGGGTVLMARPRHSTVVSQHNLDLLEALRSGDAELVTEAYLKAASFPVCAQELADELGLDGATVREALDTLAKNPQLVSEELDARAYYAQRSVWQKHASALSNTLLKLHAQQPNTVGFVSQTLHDRCFPSASKECFDVLVAYAEKQGLVQAFEGRLSHPKASGAAKANEERAASLLLDALTQAGETPPTISELIKQCDLEKSLAHRMLGVLEKEGRIGKISPDFYFEAGALAHLTELTVARLEQGGATAAQLRDALGTSRKFLIPLLEYFDAKGVTVRDGDIRTLRVG